MIKFIRKNGRIIPISGKLSGDMKSVQNMRSAARGFTNASPHLLGAASQLGKQTGREIAKNSAKYGVSIKKAVLGAAAIAPAAALSAKTGSMKPVAAVAVSSALSKAIKILRKLK